MRKPKTTIVIILLFILLILLTHVETAETENRIDSSLSASRDRETNGLGVGKTQKVGKENLTKPESVTIAKPKEELNRVLENPQQEKQETKTGEVVADPKTEKLQDHKKDLIRLGFRTSLSSYIVQKCNELAPDPTDCIVAAWFMGYAESTAWRTANKNNVWGIRKGSFKTQEAAFDRWLVTYLKRWYKWIHPKYYYSPKPGLPKTRYCVDEVQPSGRVLPYCPNWYKNAMYAYRTLTD